MTNLLKILQRARKYALKAQINASESYPDFALDFQRIGEQIDKAMNIVMKGDKDE